MKKTFTQLPTMATVSSHHESGRRPRRQTIELIKQFARSYYAPTANIAIVLN